MLDEKAIEQAVQEEKDAAGFAELMKKFQKLGITSYDYVVDLGVYRYHDGDNTVELKLNGAPKTILAVTDQSKIKIRAAVQRAQAGGLSFDEFCELAAAAGIKYWNSDLKTKMVNYFDFSENLLLSEPIPGL